MDSDPYFCNDPIVLNDCDVCILADHRLFYLHHSTLSSYWFPPRASWNCSLGLPYAWEQAVDSTGTLYFINHLTRETTYEDPRQTASRRTVHLYRDPKCGYGFVAASQRPVVVQFVSPAGPSSGKLFVNDQILSVNGIDVGDADKEKVVDLIRKSSTQLTLIVSQVPSSQRRDRRRQCRVRFKERVFLASDGSPSDSLLLIPNVMRVFLENGQTKSFKYDRNTCVSDVMSSLAEKLRLSCIDYFSLVLETSHGSRLNRFSLLANEQKLSEVAARPSSSRSRCLFRVVFIPHDALSLLVRHPNVFEYFYQQCVADVVSGRFAYEMRYEACVRLAALHLQQVAFDTNCLKDGRVSVTKLEKEYGLEVFLPAILLDNVRRKDIKKHLRFYLKKDSSESNNISSCTLGACAYLNEPSSSSSLRDSDARLSLRLKYVQIVSHLPTLGGRCFPVTFKESQTDMIMQVDASAGVLVRHPGKTNQPTISIAFELFDALSVTKESDVLRVLTIALRNSYQQGLEFILDKDDIDDLVLYIKGYYKLAIGFELPCTYCEDTPENVDLGPTAGWNYSVDSSPGEKFVNLSLEPPAYSVAVATYAGVRQRTQLDKKTSEGNAVDKSERRQSLLKATDSLLLKQRRVSQLTKFTAALSGDSEHFSSSSDTEESSCHCSRRDSICRTNRAVYSSGDQTSFGLNSPDQVPRIDNFADVINAEDNKVDEILMLIPDKICTDPDLIDLTAMPLGEETIISTELSSLNSEERKHVRFDFSATRRRCQSAAPPDTSDRKPQGGSSHRQATEKNARRNNSAHFKSILSSSHTFPVTARPMDFTFQDYASRSHSISAPLTDDGRVQIRRMSLKEFTGLEGSSVPRSRVVSLRDFTGLEQLQPQSLSAIVENKPSTKESKTANTSLIDTYSTRRRSAITSDKVTESANAEPFEETDFEDIKEMDFEQVKQRLEGMRSRLEKTMNGLPNQSPKKKINMEHEKVELLNESRRLAGACKAMVRAVSGEEERHWATIVHEVVECVDRVTSITERIVQRSNSVFQAQLMTAKTDQMLRSLLETLSSMESAKDAQPSSDYAKALISRSTTLAATITQLIQAVRNM
uniref:FERM and PDZ domain-containing protein 4 n=1 Tax=Parascaris univalens TaxID=6257 RepID=A0A915B8E5_PARUN